MEENNHSKALIVYNPKQNKKRFHGFKSLILNYDSDLKRWFFEKRKYFLFSVIVFSFFFLSGNCFAAHYIKKLPYILDVFFDKYDIKAFLITFSFIFASGYTIFGSFLSVCFFALFSFFIGNFVFSFYSINAFNFQFLAYLFVVFFLIFCCSIFCIEAFTFYSYHKGKARILFTRFSCKYLLTSSALVLLMNTLLFTIKYYFW